MTQPAVPGSTADITVIGAGAIGICCALYLQREGFTVRVVDRGQIAGEASQSNAAFISADDCVPLATPALLRRVPGMLLDPLGPLAIRWRYLPRLTPWLYQFVRASAPSQVERISTALMSLLEPAVASYDSLLAEFDADHLITKSGLLYVYGSDRAFAADRLGIELRRRQGVRLELLDGDQVAAREPLLAGKVKHGVYYSASAFTPNPLRLVRTLADQFVRAGGEIVNAEVVGIDLVDSRPQRLRTRDGSLAVDRIVVAAGAWSGRFARQLGTDVPLDTERGYLMELPAARPCPRIPFLAVDSHVAVTPTEAGLRLAGGVEFAGLTAAPNLKRADALLKAVEPLVGPVDIRGAMRWMSFRPSMPDSLPVIGWAPRTTGAYLAFGHGHLGLSLAAITGRLVAEAMAERQPSLDLAPFSADRWRRTQR